MVDTQDGSSHGPGQHILPRSDDGSESQAAFLLMMNNDPEWDPDLFGRDVS